MRSKSFGERIADVLIEEGLLLPNQLEEAIGIQKSEGGRLLKILTERQFVTDQDMVFSMGRCLNTPPVNLSRLRVPEEVMSLVPREMAKANRLVPIARLDGKLFVAMADPTNVLAIDDLKRRVQLEIVPMIATEQAVNDALSGIHTSSANMSQVLKKVAEEAVQTGEVEVHAAKHEEIDLDRLAADSEDAPVIKIVNLILDKAALTGGIDQMGIDPDTLNKFKKAIDAPHGMILVTGPTGSGKTTTLYSVLHELNNPVYNIVTVEDPIEYELMGINQVAVRSDIGLDFSSALRSILRQDPDIVMVGEIRDNETADIAVKAALTGHQVLSTLHTNDAAGAITRLDDMGIEPFLISSSILMTCAQRLVRKICTNCREEFMPEPEIFTRLGVEAKPETVFYRGSGCDRCKGRGYLGRLAIIEALTVTEAVRRLIMKRASAAVIKNQAVTEGMKTLRMAGIDKALEGQTTLEEVLRVAADDH